jgi:hypothetical protein
MALVHLTRALVIIPVPKGMLVRGSIRAPVTTAMPVTGYNGGTRYYYGGPSYYFGGSGYPYYGYSSWPYASYGYYPYSYYAGYPYSYYGGYSNAYSYYQPGYGYDTATVAAVQRRLGELGYYHGVVDGIMGSQTRAAIAAFESTHGMIVDGMITTRLLNRMGV